ncbi:MAG: peptidase S8, partial [Ignavibacteria bacterium CG08_land_8_20_14_0_20_37_9]
YPNPFNPSTTISYEIPKAGFVWLKLYDVLGREVATLVNEEKIAAKYDIEFKANILASGVYFYQLRAGEFVQTKKMVLLR